MLDYFWILLGILVYTTHSFLILKFSVSLLKYSNKNVLLLLLLSFFNLGAFFSAYYAGLPCFSLYLVSYATYFINFRIVSKTSIRQIWFASASYLVNIAGVHMLVLVISSIILRLPLIDIYNNETLFFQSIAISYILLIGVLWMVEKFLSGKKLAEISTAKMYSEIMSGTSTLLFLFLTFDSWFLMHNELDLVFHISIISTIFFVVVMYYNLFFFNTYITVLHPYKRKADEAASLHGKVIEKKIAAEYKLYTDDLTKLYNKRFIYFKIDELCENRDHDFALIYADLVALKDVNDTHGHKAGDRYILNVSQALLRSIREDDYSARVGGDEFVIILTDVTSTDMDVIVNRIIKSIQEINEKEPFTVHANLGYKCFSKDEKNQTRKEVLEIVDNLMKKDKKSFYEQGGTL